MIHIFIKRYLYFIKEYVPKSSFKVNEVSICLSQVYRQHNKTVKKEVLNKNLATHKKSYFQMCFNQAKYIYNLFFFLNFK